MKLRPTSLSGVRSLRGTRLTAAAVLSSVIAAGTVVGAMAATGGGASPQSDGFIPSMHFDDVVALAERDIGDGRIVSASLEGSVLSVKLDLTRHSSQAAQMKGVFDAQLLGHAVADWMRFHHQSPITAVGYHDIHDKAILGYGQDPLESDPSVSPLGAAACKSAATPVAKRLLTIGSARTLPYLHGACVFIFRTAKPLAGSQEAAGALGRMRNAIGAPNLRPFFFELTTRSGVPLSSAAWMPDAGGTTWAKPGFAYALAHG